MNQQATAPALRHTERDVSVPDRIIRQPSLIRTRIDTPLLIVCFCLLSLSVFSSLPSPAYLVLLLAAGGMALYASYLNGVSLERIHERQVALFLVVLTHVYLISLSKDGTGKNLLGVSVIDAANLMGIIAFALWMLRMARLKTFRIIRSTVDLAVLLLLFVTSVFFLSLYVLIDLTNLSMQLELDLPWIVLMTSLLTYVLRDLLGSPSAVKGGLRILVIPLMIVCFWSLISVWRTP